jgi:nitrite reductase/ring-hydroxylating ferredoxin subunit
MARLVNGTLLDDGRLQCPHHLANFNLADGQCDPGWVLPPLMRYATKVQDGHILVPDPLVAF